MAVYRLCGWIFLQSYDCKRIPDLRPATANNLKLCITAGVGSDHVDLDACNERKISVCEVSGSNVVAVAEHVMMTILVLLRNFVSAHEQVMAGGQPDGLECRAWGAEVGGEV
jgi:lactate dehydrogenase-like 2-hydroxyacid dehydrogenase